MGSLQTLHTRSCDTAASVARQYILTRRTYGTEAVSVISTLRENRYRPNLFPDVAQCQDNTSYIKPFRTNALEFGFLSGSVETPGRKENAS